MAPAVAGIEHTVQAPHRSPGRVTQTKLVSWAVSKCEVGFSIALRLALQLHFQEISDHLVAALGEDAFRMELHALHRQVAMAQTHDD